jgi:hypothetical protein
MITKWKFTPSDNTEVQAETLKHFPGSLEWCKLCVTNYVMTLIP